MISNFFQKCLPRIWVAFAAISCWAQAQGPAGGGFNDRTFDFYHEFFGPRAFLNPEVAANLQNRMANGVSLQPPLDSALVEFVRSRRINLMVDPVTQAKRDVSAATLAAQQKAIEALTGIDGINKVLWNVMPEWDQSGGSWVPDGRPRYTGLSREQAYLRFLNYYRSTYPALQALLGQPPASRQHWLTAITDHPAKTFYAYEMGADVCLLERSIDELGDISTGIAFVRGAARQYNRQWGVDVSTFRTSNNMATRFDNAEILLGGWSPSYLRRHYFLAYMSGAHILRNEATAYYRSLTQLDPFGRMNKDFADFALARHPDVGRPAVSTALLLDHYSGFDTKHWIFNQADSVWYQDIPYSEGDRMINNFFKVAYPNHWLHGQTPNAPFNDATGKPDVRGFQNYLAQGGDPRPYEPMGATRYGHSLDVITSRASLDALSNYRVIVMLGSVPVDVRLRDALVTWVREGGTLVTSVGQHTAFDEAFLGVKVGSTSRRATSSTWRVEPATLREASYLYSSVTPVTAVVLAASEFSEPTLTANTVGRGRVILSAVPYLQTAAQDQILSVGIRLFDWLASQNAAATVTGEPIEYLVNQAPGRVIVTIVNNTGQEWTGSVLVPDRGEALAVREYVLDQDAQWTRTREKVKVNGHVPPYDVRVYAVEFGAR